MYARLRKNGLAIDNLPYSDYEQEIKRIVELCKQFRISIKSITGMQHGLGLPNKEGLEELLNWCKENVVDLSSITCMQSGLGVTNIEDLELLKLKINNYSV